VAAPIYALAQSQSTGSTRYTVIDLGPVGPSSSEGQPFTINAHGLVSGEAVVANPNDPSQWVSQAVLGDGTRTIDIGVPGLGSPNSVAYGLDSCGLAVGQADTQTPDPNGEDFCGSTAVGLTHSGKTCEPFLWVYGSMFSLPRLMNKAGKEGSNGVALQINNVGMIAGTAENGEADSTCQGRRSRRRASSSSR
jgi:hypothetical protein